MNNTRTISQSLASAAPWIIAALIMGSIVGWFDVSAAEVQGTVLMVMLVGFETALPGKAPFLLLGVAAGLGVPLLHLIVDPSTFSIGSFLSVVPGILGALGGRVAGTLLNVAGSAVDSSSSLHPAPMTDAPAEAWYRRPVEVRVLLALALTAVAIIGLPPVVDAVARAGARAPWFVALVWQIASFVGWIALTPSIVKIRAAVRPDRPHAAGVGVFEALMHLGVLGGLVVFHAEAVALVALFIHTPMGGFANSFVAAVTAYAPLDALVYSAVLGIAFASDAARYARERSTREAALTAEATEAKLESLRAQLNPHFLYNALNSAVVLANAGDQSKVVATLEQLSTMLRYVLDEKRSLVPLGEELEFVQRYLEIQKIRFGDRLQFSIDHASDLDDIPVPPLILQPLVENAVEHGIAKTIAGGSVKLTAAIDTGMLVIKIEDDGPGITSHQSAEKIGLGNTRGRLEKMFGSAASVTLAHNAAQGAISVLRIPLSATNTNQT